MSQGHISTILYRVHAGSRFCSANDLIEDIRRNIESILNSRLMIPSDYILRPSEAGADYLNDSLVNFGIADLQSLNLGDETMEARFCSSVKRAIERFELRLNRVIVEMAPSVRERLVNIEVKGALVVQPFDDIRFESGIDTDTSRFVVS